MDLYFERHDGQAVTCDDFRAAMADANSADLSGLATWCAPAQNERLHHVSGLFFLEEHATSLVPARCCMLI